MGPVIVHYTLQNIFYHFYPPKERGATGWHLEPPAIRWAPITKGYLWRHLAKSGFAAQVRVPVDTWRNNARSRL
jgi:hypothetical protein